MLRCRAVIAPILCQPAVPLLALGRSKRDFGLPPSDVDLALARVQDEDLKLLLIRYERDKLSPKVRTDRIYNAFAPRVIPVQLPGKKHSTLVHDPHPDARRAVLDFLNERLRGRT